MISEALRASANVVDRDALGTPPALVLGLALGQTGDVSLTARAPEGSA